MRIREVDEHQAAAISLDPNAALNDYTDEDGEYYTEDDEVEEGSQAGLQPSLSNRLLAAMKPASLKQSLKRASKDLAGKGWSAAHVAGNLAWILTTSMLLVGLPVLYAYDREKNASAQGGMMPLDVAEVPGS